MRNNKKTVGMVTAFMLGINLMSGGIPSEAALKSSSKSSVINTVLSKKGATYGFKLDTKKIYSRGNIIIKADDIKYKNTVLYGDLYVKSNNDTVSNVNVKGTLFIDPGKSGNATFNNVTADNIKVLSGGTNSIHFNNVSSGQLAVNSSSNTRIETTGTTKIGNTSVTSYAILDVKSGSMGAVTVSRDTTDTTPPVVEFRGSFPSTVKIQTQAVIKSGAGANIANLQISPDNKNSKVTLNGAFNNVEINKEANVEVAANSFIKQTMKITASAQIAVDDKASVAKVNVTTADKNTKITIDGSSIGIVQVNSGADLTIAEDSKANIMVNSKDVKVTAAKGAQINLDTNNNNVMTLSNEEDSIVKLDLTHLASAIDTIATAPNKMKLDPAVLNDTIIKAEAADKQAYEKAAAAAAKAAADKAAAEAAAAEKAAAEKAAAEAAAAKAAADAAAAAAEAATSSSGTTATAPIISGVSIAAGNYKIGDNITVTIAADGTGYTAANSDITINGVAVGATLMPASGNNYTVTYTVAGGNTDRLSASAIPISVVLKKSGTACSAYTTAPASEGTVTIDADKPILSSVTTGTKMSGDNINAATNENGYLYLVPEATSTSRAAIETAGLASNGTRAAAMAGIPGTLGTTGFVSGNYIVYAIDEAGNISDPSSVITLNTTSSMQSFTPVTLNQTGTVIDGNVQYANAAAVIAALPASITVTLANGRAAAVPVTWSDTDSYNAGTAGSYTFTASWGTLPDGVDNDGSLTAPTVEVAVAQGTSDMASFTPVTLSQTGTIIDGNVQYANAAAVIAALPTGVTVTLANGRTAVVPVTWTDTDTYDASTAASYTFTGAWGTLPSGVTNTGMLAAPTVEVAVAQGTSDMASFTPVTLSLTGTIIDGNVQYANAAAVIAALPTGVTVTLANGRTAVVPVTWTDTDTYDASTAASYTFTAAWGTLPSGVTNTGMLAAPTVEVAVAQGTSDMASFTPVTLSQTGAIIDGDVQYANAAAVIAALPTSITVTLANGRTAVVPVTWTDTDTYDATTAASYTFTAAWGTLPAGVTNVGMLPAPTTEVAVAQGTSDMASFTPVTLSQTGTIIDGNVQYANAAAVIAALPTGVTVTLANGRTAVVPVTWTDTDTYDASTAASYTFTAAWGTLPSGVTNTGMLTAPTTEVAVAQGTSDMTSFTPVTLSQTGTIIDGNVQYANAAAVIAALPSSITVTLANGRTAVVPVTWTDTDTYDATTAASYTFTAAWGTLPAGVTNAGMLAAPTTEVAIAQGTSDMASFTPVTLSQTGTIIDGNVQYANAAAVIAALPTSITVTLANGRTAVVPVTWTDTDTYDATTPASYTFTGAWGTLPAGITNAGMLTAPTTEVAVAQGTSDMASFTPVTLSQTGSIGGGNVQYANAAAVIAVLPTGVTVTLANGRTAVVPVTWTDTDTYDATTAASYTFTAAWGTLPAGVTNAGMLTAPTTEVVVAQTVSMTSFAPVIFTQTGTIDGGNVQYAGASDVIAALPTAVTVALSDGLTASVPVTWTDTDTYNSTIAGSYTFTAAWGALPAGVDNLGALTAPTTEVVVAQN